ncbi:MAG: hypothetical protein HDKAJFGB_00266 [Anaerolineae bacterium]|nr:hypothetical protein [Anaerolineae bacterium]
MIVFVAQKIAVEQIVVAEDGGGFVTIERCFGLCHAFAQPFVIFGKCCDAIFARQFVIVAHDLKG